MTDMRTTRQHSDDNRPHLSQVTRQRIATTTGALLSALVLLLGAIASWFGGRMGTVEPTITTGRRVV